MTRTDVTHFGRDYRQGTMGPVRDTSNTSTPRTRALRVHKRGGRAVATAERPPTRPPKPPPPQRWRPAAQHDTPLRSADTQHVAHATVRFLRAFARPVSRDRFYTAFAVPPGASKAPGRLIKTRLGEIDWGLARRGAGVPSAPSCARAGGRGAANHEDCRTSPEVRET